MKNLFKKAIPKSVWNWIRDHRLVLRDIVGNFGMYTCSVKYCGYALYYSRGTTLIGRIRGGKIFEPELSEALAKAIKSSKPGLFLDIGSNIGIISLYIASQFPDIQITAFEPGPHQYTFFKKTIAANSLASRITLHNLALSDKNGTQTFVTHSGKDSSKDGFVNTNRGEGAQEIKVTTKTLDTWWEEAGKPAVPVIKVDTEGAELFILRGAQKVLASCRPNIFLEIEPRNLVNFPYKADDIIQWLIAHNYKVSKITEDTYHATPQ